MIPVSLVDAHGIISFMYVDDKIKMVMIINMRSDVGAPAVGVEVPLNVGASMSVGVGAPMPQHKV